MVPAFIRVANKLWSSLGAKVSLVAQLVKNLLVKRPWFDSWVRNIPWRRDRLPTPGFLGFPGGSDSTESGCNVGDLDSIPGLGRSRGGRNGNMHQYSCLENLHGLKSLVGYNPRGHKKSDTTERLSTQKLVNPSSVLLRSQ